MQSLIFGLGEQQQLTGEETNAVVNFISHIINASTPNSLMDIANSKELHALSSDLTNSQLLLPLLNANVRVNNADRLNSQITVHIIALTSVKQLLEKYSHSISDEVRASTHNQRTYIPSTHTNFLALHKHTSTCFHFQSTRCIF